MNHSIVSLFRNIIDIITNCFTKYIQARMDGIPYFVNTISPTKHPVCENAEVTKERMCSRNNRRWFTIVDYCNISSSPQLQMPQYLNEAIGHYGNEIHGTLDSSINDSVEILHKYIESLDLPTYKTFHTFEDCLSSSEHNALQDIKYSVICKNISSAHPKHIIVPIVSMNELYVSCIGADGSDRVFETPHIDGLFAWLPWCIVYRAVVSIQGNRHVDTVFPLSQHKYTLETGDYVAFDYNRSIHYIVGTSPTQGGSVDTRKRIVLKLHYLVYPEWLPVWISRVYVSIHGNYNAFLRGLFLKSQITTETDMTLEKTPETITFEEKSFPGITQRPTFSNTLMHHSGSITITQRCIATFINNGTTLYVKLFLVVLYLCSIFGIKD